MSFSFLTSSVLLTTLLAAIFPHKRSPQFFFGRQREKEKMKNFCHSDKNFGNNNTTKKKSGLFFNFSETEKILEQKEEEENSIRRRNSKMNSPSCRTTRVNERKQLPRKSRRKTFRSFPPNPKMKGPFIHIELKTNFLL